MKRLYPFLCFFLLLSSIVYSQDLIIHKNGSKIYCKILSVDSTQIAYNLPRVKGKMILRKTEVESYHVAEALKKDSVFKPVRVNDPILMFEFRGGRATPIKEFASKDLRDEKAGLANKGFLIQVNIILKANKYIGLTGGYHFQSNPFDADVIRNELMTQYPGTIFTCTSKSWQVKGLMGGVYLNVPLDVPGLDINLSLSGGFPKHVIPELVSRGNPFGQMVTVTQSSATTNSFASELGLGIKYTFENVVALALNVGYNQSTPHFSSIVTSSTNGFRSVDKYTQRFKTVTLQAGILFLIARK